ncbi:MAG: hypothetical protein II625_10015 [Bacilli bacterium]|nr:hypothetical protein [Bacilli bacterium]
MRKRIILIMLPLLLLTGCKDKNDELFIEQEKIVKEELKSVDLITEDAIKEKYLYLKDNYDSYDKSQKEKIVYSAKYIQTISAKSDNELTKIADQILIYVKSPSSELLEKLNIMFKNVETKENKIISDIYNSYMIENKVKEIILAKQDQVAADLKDKNLRTAKYLKEGINYIEKNIEEPFKNNEVIENLVYYSMFFDGLSKKGNVKSLGTKTLAYLKTLDDSKYNEVINLLKKMNKDKDIKKVLEK